MHRRHDLVEFVGRVQRREGVGGDDRTAAKTFYSVALSQSFPMKVADLINHLEESRLIHEP